MCDFDGTISLNDTYEYVLTRYAPGDWRVFDDEYLRGEISLQECLRKQWGPGQDPGEGVGG